MSTLNYLSHISLTGSMKCASETDTGFAIEFKLLEIENCPVYADWLDWGDIARVYGCTVFEDVELYRNCDFEDFNGTTVYEPEDGKVVETRILPEHKLEDYAHEFDRLIEINSKRYRPLKISCFENLIRWMKNEVNGEQIEFIKDNLKHNKGHAAIPEGITYIPSLAFSRCKDLKSIYIPKSVSDIGKMNITFYSDEVGKQKII